MLAWVEPYAIATRLGSMVMGTAWDGLGELAVRARVSLPAGQLRLDQSWMALAAASGALVFIAAAFKRRVFCRWFCPTGAILELAGKRALLGFRIEASACASCGACERVCRTGAASSVGKYIDAGACVSCFDCLSVCPTGATSYGSLRKSRGSSSEAGTTEMHAVGVPPPVDTSGRPAGNDTGTASTSISRRSFLLAGGTGLAAAAVVIPAVALVPGDTAKATVSLNGVPRMWASPPGSGSLERYSRLCISCGLCARACPSGVLRQSTAFWKFPSVLVPYMDYERAFCQFECVACGEVCPTGAIKQLPVTLKTVVAVAKSKLDLPKCIVVEKGTRCGACAEHCPSGALGMEKVPGAVHPGPVLDDTLCIGCGACETVCPSEPVKALVVSGLRIHETARVLPVRPGSGAQSSPVTGAVDDADALERGETGQDAPQGGGTQGFAF
jgi:ferredoxin